MHIDSEQLFREWLPVVKQWAAAKFKTLKCKRFPGIKDLNCLECDAVAALHRAVVSWPGAGPFKGYLRAAVQNAWRDQGRRERRHVHHRLPEAGRDDDVGKIDSADDYEAVSLGDERDGPDTPVLRQRRHRFRGGDSEVLKDVYTRELRQQFDAGGLRRAMQFLNYSAGEITEYIQRTRRSVAQQDRRHRETAQLRDSEAVRQRFHALFADPAAA